MATGTGLDAALANVADVVFPVASVVDKAGMFVTWEGRPRWFDAVFTNAALHWMRNKGAIPYAYTANLGQPDKLDAMTDLLKPFGIVELQRTGRLGPVHIDDVSARDVQMATSQWILGKSFDTFCPMGPAIVTASHCASNASNVG